MMLLQLLALHFLCDFPLQGFFLAKGKNHQDPLDGVPWQICLVAHAVIHAGAYSLLVRWEAAVLVGFAHLLVDYSKCEGWLGEREGGFWLDQALHVLVLVLLAWWGAP